MTKVPGEDLPVNDAVPPDLSALPQEDAEKVKVLFRLMSVTKSLPQDLGKWPEDPAMGEILMFLCITMDRANAVLAELGVSPLPFKEGTRR